MSMLPADGHAPHSTDPSANADGMTRDPLWGTPYETIARIGEGGMGEVMEAVHRGLHKRVVVKLLHLQIAGDPRFADRLRVEAQALAAVESPHVVSVSDLGCTPNGRPYLVMELLKGQTLRQVLDARGAIPVTEAIGWICQLLDGLAAAHRVGIIHRDIKPDNVFLCLDPSGVSAPLIKVLDFGIAKILQAHGREARLQAPQYATEQGMLIGSPRTVAPEQVRFQAIDARTDIYAAGLLLYTLIAGDGPFAHAQDMLQLLNAHVLEAPAPPSQRAAQYVPPELDRAILKALAKKPELRFQTAAQFAAELNGIVTLQASKRTPTPVTDVQQSMLNEAATRHDLTPRETLPLPKSARGTLLMIKAPQPAAPQPAAPQPAAPQPAAPQPAAPPHVATQLLPAYRGPEKAPAADLEEDAWFAPEEGAAPILSLPPNLAPESPRRLHMGTFAVLTLASTVLFSALAVLVFRLLAAP